MVVLGKEKTTPPCKAVKLMRDRLIEKLTETFDEQYAKRMLITPQHTADSLLADGWIRPPCKVGDLLYMPWEYDGNSGVALLSVTYMVIDKDKLRIMTDFSTDDDVYYDLYFGGRFVPSDFGKTVFLTREDAEQKLKEVKT